MTIANPEVDIYLDKVEMWKEELTKLRMILLDCGLTEELKWHNPCYTFQKSNVAIIDGLKEYCVLSFFKGALLSDVKGILEKPGANTQSARVIPFTGVQAVVGMAATLKEYIYEAIEVEKAGVTVDFKKPTLLIIPEEFQQKLAESKVLKNAFEALTPGRQRAYNLYFSAPKQSNTREKRIEKCLKKILNGKGLND